MGLMMGYILHVTKDVKIDLSPLTNLAIWSLVFLTAFSLVYGPHSIDNINPLNDTEEQRTLETMWKFGWGLVLSWVTFACVRGYGGIVNDFLSWGVWASISKISFMTYLFHMSLNWWISRDIL